MGSAVKMLAEKMIAPIARGEGPPMLFHTPEDMAVAILEYFDYCEEHDAPLTVSGMMLSTNATRRTFYNYLERPAFKEVAEAAQFIISTAYEEKLDRPKCAGAIFALKNVAGWSDRRTVTTRAIAQRIDWSMVNDAQLDRMKAGEDPIAVLGTGVQRYLKGETPEAEGGLDPDAEIVQETAEEAPAAEAGEPEG